MNWNFQLAYEICVFEDIEDTWKSVILDKINSENHKVVNYIKIDFVNAVILLDFTTFFLHLW